MAATGVNGIHPLFSVENTLLNISSQAITEGILYIMPVQIDLSDQKYLVLR